MAKILTTMPKFGITASTLTHAPPCKAPGTSCGTACSVWPIAAHIFAGVIKPMHTLLSTIPFLRSTSHRLPEPWKGVITRRCRYAAYNEGAWNPSFGWINLRHQPEWLDFVDPRTCCAGPCFMASDCRSKRTGLRHASLKRYEILYRREVERVNMNDYLREKTDRTRLSCPKGYLSVLLALG